MTGSPLEFAGVARSFPRGRERVQALQDLDFSLVPGGITGLLGPDGAGKSTLMRLAAGLLLPDRGQVTVLGTDTRGDLGPVQTQTGYMPQRFGLYEDLTVQENLDLYADLQGLAGDPRYGRLQELLKLTALGPFGHRRAGALSGGMKQKLGLACALLRTPRLLLLDEPTVGVDPIARRELWSIVQGLRSGGVTILLSTAYFDEAERCDEILLLHQGRLLGKKTPAEFRAPLEGRTFLVGGPAPVTRRQLQESLRQRPGIQDARILAGGVRVLCRDPTPRAAGGETWLPVPPAFEDAFVDRLGAQEEDRRPVSPPPVAAAPGSGVPEETAVIRVRGLRKVFGQFEAVRAADFDVYPGEIFGLLGANGAGKTTTFRMLCGLLPASSGTLEVAGVDMRHASAVARSRIGYVSQRFSLYGNLNCHQNLSFFASVYGLHPKKRRARLAWALEEFRLGAYRNASADDLPLGIRQRLALACALLHEPPILFLDEPTSGVDPLSRREFWQRISHLAEQGVTVLVTTHFMDEAEYCDRLVLMSLGEILAQGSPAEIRALARDGDHPEPGMEEAFIRLTEVHESRIRRAS